MTIEPRSAAADPPVSRALLREGRTQERPPRPSLQNPKPAPVIVKQPAPFAVRVAQFLWVFSLFAASLAAVFFVVIREDQLPLIADAIRGVDGTRPEATYTQAANVIFWAAFGLMMGIILFQITLLVSFMGRKRGVRWWQLLTIVIAAIGFAVLTEMVTGGENGTYLRQMFAAQLGLAVLAMLFSIFPAGMAWSARQYDLRTGPIYTTPGGEL